MKHITVIGLGYVGLVTAASIAKLGHYVIGVGRDKKKIEKLKKSIIPFYEPGLKELVKLTQKSKRLSFTTHLPLAISKSEIIFIAVGTPSGLRGEADLSQVKTVAKQIGELINGYKVIGNKSTVPVGTGNLVYKIIEREVKKRAKDFNFDVVSNPEFLREGRAIDDFMHPDRMVIGDSNKKARAIMKELYQSFHCPFLVTDLETAELIKYASNAMLATQISFINSLAHICEKVGADISRVAWGMKLDQRIGKNAFLKAGVGYGGSCFPKDVLALIQIGKKVGFNFGILKEVEKINQDQRNHLLGKLKRLIPDLRNKIIGIWGLSFKPETDDLREAPSLTVISRLIKEGALVQVFDPVAMNKARLLLKEKQIIRKVKYCLNPYGAAKDAWLVLILTEWQQFKKVDWEKVRKAMRYPHIIDGRNMYEPKAMAKLGFNYMSVGR